VLRGILERVGHRVTTVNDGESALDLLESAGHEIDVMILDMNMPKRTGLDVFRAFRFMTPDRQIPTIILTADATPDALAACREAGVDAYLTKPVDTMKLLATLARFGKAPPASAPETGVSRSRVNPAIAEGEVPLLDLGKIESLKDLGAGSGFLTELIGGFLRDSRRCVAAIEAANEGRNYVELHDALHALRGSAGELGAIRIAHVCQQLRALKPFELGLARSLKLVEHLQSVQEETALHLDEYSKDATGQSVKP
jgi:two-component system sensor histidine kinase RpfC